MSKAILIASYYRSGTSALSGALNLLGVDIVNTDERNEHNPRGYFENPVLAKMDLELFERLGRRWHDIRLMPDQWWQRPDVGADTQRIVAELRTRHSESRLWAVKHPHLCRLLPIYEEAANRASGQAPSVIHIYRDPWVVAHSQLKKNGLSRAHALLLWASYVLDGECYARHLNRVVLDYELLVKDARLAMKRIATTLEVEFPHRSTQDFTNIYQFLTPQLRRSRPRGRDSTPTLVRGLIDDVWEAVLSEASPEQFADLRTRFVDQCELLDELAASGLAVTATLAPGLQRASAQSAESENHEAEGSPLRPAERTDIAERQRLARELEDRVSLPTVAILVSVPAGRVETAFETARSVEKQWHAPHVVHYLCADPDSPQRDGWFGVTGLPGGLTEALAEHAQRMVTDYVAIVDAGDRLEPDACARLCLFAEQSGQPALIYTDEIVANAKNPWIRYKPDFDIERLRGLHYLGGWLWYQTRFLREHAPLDGQLTGAEDFDVALRAYDASAGIEHLPEALYARAPDSRRDTCSADVLRTHAHKVLTAHLARCGLQEGYTLQDGVVPGSFAIRQQPVSGKGISLVLLCDDAESVNARELDPQRLHNVIRLLGLEHLVCAATRKHADVAIRGALERLQRNNPVPDRLHVVHDAASEAQMLRHVAETVGTDAVILLSLDASTTDPDWLGHLQGKLYNQNPPIGMIGASADYQSAEGVQRRLGPLLLGGNEGVGIIGLGRTADDPGPGGWLLSAQSADGVMPPCLAVRGEVLKQLEFAADLSGAQLWLDLSMQVWQQGWHVIWDPAVRVSCPRPPTYTTRTGPDTVAANRRLRARWGCRSRHHHPMLALQGDNLSPLGNPGLCATVPRSVPEALLSGAVEGAEYALEWLRVARMKGDLRAGWTAEPIAITELRRLAPEAWLRVNPETAIETPDAPAWQALFTRPPHDKAPLKRIGGQVERSFATSPTLATALRKRSYNRLQPDVLVPRLPARLWRDFDSTGSIGRHRVRVLWVDEGDPPDWMVQLLNIGEPQWFVVEGGRQHYDGPIATFQRPTDENGWFELFRTAAPHAVIRPARDATWMDCQLLLRGAAAGAALFADPRLDWPEELPVTAVPARFDDWSRILRHMREDSEGLAAAGRQARASLERIGWLEDDPGTQRLLAPAPVLLANDAG